MKAPSTRPCLRFLPLLALGLLSTSVSFSADAQEARASTYCLDRSGDDFTSWNTDSNIGIRLDRELVVPRGYRGTSLAEGWVWTCHVEMRTRDGNTNRRIAPRTLEIARFESDANPDGPDWRVTWTMRFDDPSVDYIECNGRQSNSTGSLLHALRDSGFLIYPTNGLRFTEGAQCNQVVAAE